MTAPTASSLADTMIHSARSPIRAPSATMPVSSTRMTSTRRSWTSASWGTRTPKAVTAPTAIPAQALATTAAANCSSRISAQPMIHAQTSPKMT